MDLFNSTWTCMVISFLYDCGHPNNHLTVDTIYGALTGRKSAVSRNGRTYYEFLGIPYARPPIGELRFEPPLPPEAWNGSRPATSHGNPCLQIRLFANNRIGDEDCLNLNVHTHQIQSRELVKPLETLHPVIYYIHGGFFMSGAAHIFGAKYYMDEDVVLVTANYRVASLGFLNTGDGEVRGNMGLKDQVMVLKWIRANIQYFGGDPNRVTIVGESAGAAASHYHMLSPMSTGLFHRVISQSGTALAPWALNSNPGQQAKNFAQKLNCARNSTAETVACLKRLEATTLIEAHSGAVHHLENEHSLFRPSVEFLQDNLTFLGNTPTRILEAGGAASVPWLAGANSEEGLIFAAAITRNETKRKRISSNWTTLAPSLFGYEKESRRAELSQKIWEFYFGQGETELTEDSWPNVTKLMSDYHFFNNLHEGARMYQDGIIVNSTAYFYYFTYQAQFSLGKMIFGMTGYLPLVADLVVSSSLRWFSTNVLGQNETHYGACHGDEVFLMFEMPFQPVHKEGTVDYQISKDLVKLWTSFAKDGKPDSTWNPVELTHNKSQVKYMELGQKFELIDEPFHNRIEFWKSLKTLQSSTKPTRGSNSFHNKFLRELSLDGARRRRSKGRKTRPKVRPTTSPSYSNPPTMKRNQRLATRSQYLYTRQRIRA